MPVPQASQPGALPPPRQVAHLGTAPPALSVVKAGCPASVPDSAQFGFPSSAQCLAQLELLLFVCSTSRSGASSAALDPLHSGFSLALRSSACSGFSLSVLAASNAGSTPPPQQHACMGSLMPPSGLARLDFILLVPSFSTSDASTSLQTFACSASSLFPFGWARVGLPSLASDCVEMGSTLPLRAALRLGASTSSTGTCNSGGAMPALDYTTMASFVSSRNHARSGSVPSLFGTCCSEPPLAAPDSAVLEFLLLGCSSIGSGIGGFDFGIYFSCKAATPVFCNLRSPVRSFAHMGSSASLLGGLRLGLPPSVPDFLQLDASAAWLHLLGACDGKGSKVLLTCARIRVADSEPRLARCCGACPALCKRWLRTNTASLLKIRGRTSGAAWRLLVDAPRHSFESSKFSIPGAVWQSAVILSSSLALATLGLCYSCKASDALRWYFWFLVGSLVQVLQ